MSSLQQPSSGEGASTASNLLDCDSVLELLQALLPTSISANATTTTSGAQTEGESTSTTTILSSPYEGLAALTHAMMTAVGFRLVGLGEDDSFGADRLNIEGKVQIEGTTLWGYFATHAINSNSQSHKLNL
ncbi:hypothetical protein BGX27_005380 [Mortierella sp. AM989]|nr:hypothetical protein BGX27_005380 [Mortierella sp. AM989]